VTDLEAAWDALRAATPAGWFVGRPPSRIRAENGRCTASTLPSGPSQAVASGSG
jgi:hypothetical protein